VLIPAFMHFILLRRHLAQATLDRIFAGFLPSC
jgi:hypothetical protein